MVLNIPQYAVEATIHANMNSFFHWMEHDEVGIAFRQTQLANWQMMERQGLGDVGGNAQNLPEGLRASLNFLYQLARQANLFDPYGNETRYAEEAANDVYLAPFKGWLHTEAAGRSFCERNQAAWNALYRLGFNEDNQTVPQIPADARVVLELLYRIARHSSQYEPPAGGPPGGGPPGGGPPGGGPPGGGPPGGGPPGGGPPGGPPPGGGPPGGGPPGGGPHGGGPPGGGAHGGGPPGGGPHGGGAHGGGPPGGGQPAGLPVQVPPGPRQEGATLPPSQEQEAPVEQGPSKKAKK